MAVKRSAKKIATTALKRGRDEANRILDLREAAHERRKVALEKLKKNDETLALRVHMTAMGAAESVSTLETAGFLAAAGDSWFDYPFHDVLKMLDDDFGYNVESSAHRGDPIERMAYQGGQLEDFARKLEKIQAQGATPKAVLLSGGGDDMAGDEFGMLLNNFYSPVSGWDKKMLSGLLEDRISTAYTQMLGSITKLCQGMFQKTVPILVHGYDYPVPDGRGFLGGWPFPGPWLEPGFRQKNFEDLGQRISMMMDVMDRFNKLVSGLSKCPGLEHVCYIDLRGTLSNKPANYKLWWANELHPTEDGFRAVTRKFVAVLQTLP